MKIALFTFHFNDNYGAALQAYATASVLRVWGHDVVVPHYIPLYHHHLQSPIRGLGLRRPGALKRIGARASKLLFQARNASALRQRHRKFESFRSDYLRVTQPVRSVEAVRELISDGVDACVVGSDQVWNLNFQSRYENYYFLGMLGDKIKRISYAACFGQEKQPERLLASAAEDLKKFDSLSVRNEFSRQLLRQAAGLEGTVVVDPTMLHSFSEFLHEGQADECPCIMVYSLNRQAAPQMADAIATAKRGTGLPVICYDSDDLLRLPGVDEYRQAAGPIEWVKGIRGAKIFITDSFHGCVFAAKYQTPLIACVSGWRSARVEDFLSRYGMGQAIMRPGDRVPAPLALRRDQWEAATAKDVEHSKTYLQSAIAHQCSAAR